MYHIRTSASVIRFIILCFILISCSNTPKHVKDKMVSNPEKMDEQASETIKDLLDFALQNQGKLDDSTHLKFATLVNEFYIVNGYSNSWSKKEKWQSKADSLFIFIDQALLFGLFPKDYQSKKIHALKKILDTDSVQKMNAVLWSKADVLFTDATIGILKDLKYGRLVNDSLNVFSDTSIKGKWLTSSLQSLMNQSEFITFLNSVEPSQIGYHELKNGIKKFVDSMDHKTYSYVTYPYKKNDAKDSVLFIKALQKRLLESKCISNGDVLSDTLQIRIAIKKFQKIRGIKQDGAISTSLIKMMNSSDTERFKRIAITLDRYKLLPDSMPEKFIWVNLPGFYLQVWDHDTIAIISKIICGKPETRTPLLTSNISDMITYPTWTVPTSIIAKQYLPKLKADPNYLTRIGLKLVTEKGVDVDAATINWSKYSKGIPFKVMQNSGDDNALGVIKFNFNNPFAVYLHDTNQRYLFKNSSRALSHGCVRVQEWEKLAVYIARNDSMNLKEGDTLRYTVDSILNWITAKKHQRINVKNKLPLFITYFSCEGKNGKIKFYEDIYGDDKELRERYFTDK